jgi:hypothetical protein
MLGKATDTGGRRLLVPPDSVGDQQKHLSDAEPCPEAQDRTEENNPE